MIQENSERLFNKLRYKNQQIKGDFAKETETIRKRTKKKKKLKLDNSIKEVKNKLVSLVKRTVQMQ